MHKQRFWRAVVLFLFLLSTMVTAAHQQTAVVLAQDGGATEIVSVASDGTIGNGESHSPSISADGRYVAFSSDATNLVDGDTNQVTDCFVHDRQTGETTLISTELQEGDWWGGGCIISGDGRYVLYDVDWAEPFYGEIETITYIHDRQTGVSTIFYWGSQYYVNWGLDLSHDGRYVAWGEDDDDGIWLYVNDLVTNELHLVNSALNGPEDGYSWGGYISAYGQYALFQSMSTNIVADDTNGVEDLFLRDLGQSTTTRISKAYDNSEANGKSDADRGALSEDGRYITFTSEATNLVANDANGRPDVFVYDRQSDTITRVSVATDGTEGNQSSQQASITYDGRYVGFVSAASNLVPNDTNQAQDIFVYDREQQQTMRVSLSATDEQANADSGNSIIAGNGEIIAFESVATNLVAGDTNGTKDIFVRAITWDEPAEVQLVLSSSANGRIGPLRFRDEDLLLYTPSTDSWQLLFDGSDVGLGTNDINAFTFTPAGTLLLSVETAFSLGRAFTVDGQNLAVDDSDILEFMPTSLGSITSGKFQHYFDGSAKELNTTAEDIDALFLNRAGQPVVSVIGRFKTTGNLGGDEDIYRYQAESDDWGLIFDGSDIKLTLAGEDVIAAHKDGSLLYLSTLGTYAATSENTLRGGPGDIILCELHSSGENTSCQLSHFWRGRDHGLGSRTVDALYVGTVPAGLPLTASAATVDTADAELTTDGLTNDSDQPDALDGFEEQDITIFLPLIENE